MPELTTYEAFALDEACAVLIAHERQQQLDDLKQGRQATPSAEPKANPLKNKSAYEWMTSPEFKAR